MITLKKWWGTFYVEFNKTGLEELIVHFRFTFNKGKLEIIHDNIKKKFKIIKIKPDKDTTMFFINKEEVLIEMNEDEIDYFTEMLGEYQEEGTATYELRTSGKLKKKLVDVYFDYVSEKDLEDFKDIVSRWETCLY